ncbi:hypothetical protein [Hyphomicrobium sp.]|uniref:hypothetical protein n=1 Tax=Hyphomicrobium sp. TaxID=82 RepID=UPI003F71B50B
MTRIAPLLLVLMIAIPASIATPVSADPREHYRGDDFRADGRTYGDQDDNDDEDDGPSDHYGRHGDSDEDGGDDDDYGAYGPDDEFSPDEPSDGMRT